MAKKKKIKMNLSVNSIENAIKEIEKYKQSLSVKTEQLIKELGKIGIERIESSMTNIEGDSSPEHTASVNVTSSGNRVRATIILQGEDIAFIEFGAGVHYNGAVGSGYGFGKKLGYTIGSYGKGQGANDSWVYFDEEQGHFRWSQGTKAAMPMYNASVDIREQLIGVARKVFGE